MTICISQGIRKATPNQPETTIISRQIPQTQPHHNALVRQGTPEIMMKHEKIEEKNDINEQKIIKNEKKIEKHEEKLSNYQNLEKKTNYAGMAIERKVQRQNSQKEIKFEMVLRSGKSMEEMELSKMSKENDHFKISVGQKEMNSGFEKIINNFYQQEHKNKFSQIYREMIEKCDFLDNTSKGRLDILFNHVIIEIKWNF